MDTLDSDLVREEAAGAEELTKLRDELAKHQRVVKNFKFFVFFLAALRGAPLVIKWFDHNQIGYALVFPLMYFASGILFTWNKQAAIVLALLAYLVETYFRGVSSYGHLLIAFIALFFVFQLKATFEIAKIEKRLSAFGIPLISIEKA